MKSFQSAFPMLMYRLLYVVMPPFREIFSRFGLTAQQWRVMRVLWENKSCTPSRLAQLTLISKTTLVGVVDKLEERGLVRRYKSEDDRRQINVKVEPAGEELMREVEPLLAGIYRDLNGVLSEEEWKVLYALLNKIYTSGKKNPILSKKGN